MYPKLTLDFNISFEDLYHQPGLERIDQQFQTFLVDCDKTLADLYQQARNQQYEDSDLILKVAPYVEDFLAQLFQIRESVEQLQQQHHNLAPIFYVKRQFVQRIAIKKYPLAEALTFEGAKLQTQLLPWLSSFDDLSFAQAVQTWLKDEATYKEPLDLAAQYAAWATLTPGGQHQNPQSVLFKIPKKLMPEHLIELEQPQSHRWQAADHHRRLRDGFGLTDPGLTRKQAIDQANYCIWCQHQGKDSCSKGMKPKAPSTEKFQKNTFGTLLAGCPLEEKISEMNETKASGLSIGALAIITIDNPLVAATGHRICNDCMKSCIYQKQEPVNIPGVETQILKDVLQLPWGFELYSLLTRWNPLNFKRPLCLPSSGYKVLIVGMGPAGFNLAHHLLNDGHVVVGIDGLKIEPLPILLSGVDEYGQRQIFQPIYSLAQLEEPLDQRINGGFGGVAEYGITVRWDKNFLKIVRLLLQRREHFALFGGVRFGGTITVDQAFSMGFDHIALCMGAGSPTLIPMKNSLAIGVRQASDFLMALQLTGAAKKDSIANLQVRLPAVVIGGGLTAIDTATETMAYYPVQVEKFYQRYQKLIKLYGQEEIHASWNAAEQAIAEEFIIHGQAVMAERQQAAQEGRQPNFQKLVQQWGGVTVVYRRQLIQSPSYTLNHEEVEKAFEEGIQFFEQATPEAVEVDGYGYAQGLTVKGPEGTAMIPARSIFVAAGTKPNTNLRYDEPHHVILDGKFFQALDEAGHPVTPERLAKPDQAHVLMNILPHGKAMSFFGDLHPSFSGNVVKAMASAKQGYPIVSGMLHRLPVASPAEKPFLQLMAQQLVATIRAVNRLTPTIVEIVVHAPLAAKNFQPGQFYRLQNFETLAPLACQTRLAMEGLALTGASVDRENGLLSTIVLEMGGSSSLGQVLKPGEPVVLMGPTGTPTEIPQNETLLLVGGGLGNAVLFSIGQAARMRGCRVIYFAGYKNRQDRYKIAEIEAAADVIVWCCDESPGFTPTRAQDKAFVGNIVEAMRAYAEGNLGDCAFPLQQADRLIVIGSDRMMAAVAAARHNVLQPYLNPKHTALGSINSPMQCMMKEICAQCLQRHVDPITGQETIVYSCANQDQFLDQVDFSNLSARLQQNTVQEKLTAWWLKHCLKEWER
jgi:NADPH-dependent glutamate synthase beta subunit-like oxidoreductase/NAD(P)H-flavin reductase